MATLDDINSVLESIDRTMLDQKNLISTMITAQETRDRLSSVDTSAVSNTNVGQGIGAAASGIGEGIGSAAAGLGVAGLAGLAGLALFADFDAEKIKENVVTLLSISDEVGGKVEMLKEGGAFFLAMAGLGLGLAAFGIGQSISALGQWVTDDKWAETIKTNVLSLLSIADEVGGNLSLLYEGGTVGLALGGLGAGLAVFGIGQSLVGLGQWITDDTWAETVKTNVATLLSISDGIGENISNLFESGAFMSAMIGLGAGLAVFGVGQAAVGLAQFISSDDWAQQVKDSVATLLSINELPGIGWDTAGFVAVMGGIAAGLTAFALGKGAATIVEGAAEAISLFTGDNFADKIKSEVQTLLSIPQMEGVGADTVGFIATMAGIAAGLTVFALGKGAATVVDGASEALAYFTGDEPFAEKIKSEVETLLSIVSLAPEGSVDEFNNIMSKLGDGLSSFAGGNFMGALKNVGTAILGFFSGQESPFEQIRMIAADADNLIKAAGAIEKIAASLEKFGSISVDVGSIDFEDLAKNLGNALPLLNALANGGRYDPWGPGDYDFGKGILDPSLKLDEMAEAISKVNFVLGRTAEYPTSLKESAANAAAESPVSSAEADRIRMENQSASIGNFQSQMETVSAPSRAGTQVTSVADNSVKADNRSSYVGGTTVVNNYGGKVKDDLDYGLGGLRAIN